MQPARRDPRVRVLIGLRLMLIRRVLPCHELSIPLGLLGAAGRRWTRGSGVLGYPVHLSYLQEITILT